MIIVKKMKVIMKILVYVFVFFASVTLVSADQCSSQYPSNRCVNTSALNSTDGCVSNLCGGGSNVRCCPVVNVVCKSDGSTMFQPCVESGAEGQCNSAGNCVVGENAGGGSTTPPPTLQTRTNCGPTEFCNPLAFNDVESFLSHFLTVLQRIIVVLSLIFIIIGALMYITSAGNDGQVTNAKKAITAALIGLAIGLAAPSFLKEISTILGWGTTNNAAVNSAMTLSQIALRVLNFLMSILGILALLMMVVGAMFYLTAAGDEKQVEKGKKIFQYAVIGVIVAMASMIIIKQVTVFFVNPAPAGNATTTSVDMTGL